MSIKELFKNRLVQILGAAVFFFALGLLTSSLFISADQSGYLAGNSLNLNLSQNAKDGFASMSNIQSALQDISGKVLPTVVEIDVVDVVRETIPPAFSPFDFFFGPDDNNSTTPQQREFRRQGLGSGIIIRQTDNKVYVLTNNHVVDNAQEITVKFADKREFKAKLVGRDEKKDLALVMFETADRIPVAVLGDSNSVQVGDWVLAVGNPLGFDSTVTEGIISAIGRKSTPESNIAVYTDYFQTDAAINQGNSGGALVNIHGEVIGINSWIASPSGGNVGIGFAIPINNAKSAIEDFITKGKVSYGYIGVSSGDLSKASKQDLNLGQEKGAFVYGVYLDSPAFKAGILPGDFITRVNGNEITDITQLVLSIGNLKSGSKADIELIRYGRKMNLTLQVAERPEQNEEAGVARLLWPGLLPVKITDDIRTRLGLANTFGNIVLGGVEQGSPAQVAGMQTGDIVLSINNRPVNNLADFYKVLNDSGQNEAMFKLNRGNKEFSVGLVKKLSGGNL
jgi:Do/DeqQ family serine protease